MLRLLPAWAALVQLSAFAAVMGERRIPTFRMLFWLSRYRSAPQRHELTGKDGKPLTLVQLLEAIGPISDV